MNKNFIVLLIISCFSVSTVHGTQTTAQPSKATFAGGCFWCMEDAFESVPGVNSVVSGYTGGVIENPSYKEVSAGTTGHFEAIEISYDSNKISYEKLLGIFWKNIDPTNGQGQFCDIGDQYRSAIFYHTDEQKQSAEQSMAKLESNKPFVGPIKTIILPAGKFFSAEAYHQNYAEKNPIRYNFYRYTCKRGRRLQELWGED